MPLPWIVSRTAVGALKGAGDTLGAVTSKNDETEDVAYKLPELEEYIERLEEAIAKSTKFYNDSAQEISSSLDEVENIDSLDRDIDISYLNTVPLTDVIEEAGRAIGVVMTGAAIGSALGFLAGSAVGGATGKAVETAAVSETISKKTQSDRLAKLKYKYMQQKYNFTSASDELKASFDEYVSVLSKLKGFLEPKLDRLDEILIKSNDCDEYSDDDQIFICELMDTLDGIYKPMEKIVDCKEVSVDGESFTREIRREFKKLENILDSASN